MNQQSLASFIDLVTFDQNFLEIQQKITVVQKLVDGLHNKTATIQQKIAQVDIEKKDLQKYVKQQEQLLQEIQNNEEAMVAQMQTLSSSKEYDAANKQLDNLKFARRQQENKLVQAMNKDESAAKQFVQTEQSLAQELETIASEIQQQQVVLQDLNTQFKDLQNSREQKLAGIPKEWMDTYDLMRGRVSDPVVPLQQGSCSACFHGFTPRDLQLLEKNYLIQCKECYRFLYNLPKS